MIDQVVDEHVATLKAQAGYTARLLASTGRLLEIFIAEPDLDVRKLDALRSQMRACQRATRTSNQLLAQAAQLLDQAHQPQEANHGRKHEDRTPARLG